MIENESLSVTLTLENDEELECDVITIFETDARQYIALLPVNANEDSEDGQIYLYRLIDEFERVSEVFNDWMESQDFGDIDLDDIDD